ncbi:MAG: DNA-processing protein DprA [Anaerolineae bacterium]|nr:DNA-processing protein DprA [Anaerolineae bacterium]
MKRKPVSEHKYWVALNIVQGIGPAAFRALLDRFGALSAAWQAPEHALRAVPMKPEGRENLLKMRQALDLDRIMAKVAEAGARVLTWEDGEYPNALRNAPNPPPVLYIKGELTEADDWALGVVGTRKSTGYGHAVTKRIVETLARSGVTIVSGLAKGIDGVAHRAALDAGGRTIAVLGCGIDIIYPPDHRALAEDIIKSGAIVSEYPIGAKPEGKNFPPRNRIISGLSMGVLVVEAGERSGALITTTYAAEQGRDVFAVPGPILAATSRGANRLIQEGAKLVMDAEDILEELNLGMAIQQAEIREVIPATDIEARLMQLLAGGPLHIDELCRQSGLSIARVSGDLTLMELKGLVHQVGGMTYALAQPSMLDNTRYLVD